jgi:hypothetical protein
MSFRLALTLLVFCAPWSSPVLLLAQNANEPTFHTRGMSQQHAEELRKSILDAANRVNNASSVNERTRWQEELCKRLIQSEDYVNALHVANAVQLTEGADPERRAVHHFLMARIYRMMMESAPDPTAMEDARQLAMKTAQEVQAKRYPASWGIAAAAGQLQQELSSRQTIATAEFAASKRAQGGVDPRQAEAARAQTAAMEASIYGRGGIAPGSTAALSEPVGRGTNTRMGSGARPATTDPEPEPGSREEILQRLRQARDTRSGGAGSPTVPGGVAPMAGLSRSTAPVAPGGGTSPDDFPDFGASGGRQIGAPTLQGGTGIRGGSASGFSPRLPLTTQERAALAPQRMNQTGSAAANALAARGAMDGGTQSSGYIPGGVNRTFNLGQPTGTGGRQARMVAPREDTGANATRPGSYGSAPPTQSSPRGGGTATRAQSGGSDMVRFNWADAKQGPGASSEKASSRYNGPVIIDSRSGRPESVRSGATRATNR